MRLDAISIFDELQSSCAFFSFLVGNGVTKVLTTWFLPFALESGGRRRPWAERPRKPVDRTNIVTCLMYPLASSATPNLKSTADEGPFDPPAVMSSLAQSIFLSPPTWHVCTLRKGFQRRLLVLLVCCG